MKKYIKYALFAVFGFVVSSVVFTVGNNNTYKVYNNDSDKIKILKNASNNKEENLKLDKEDVLKLAQIYYKKIYDKDYEGVGWSIRDTITQKNTSSAPPS